MIKEVNDKPLDDGGYLKKEDLEQGAAYRVKARNFGIAIWDGKAFQGLRCKFGSCFMSSEDHWDEGAPFGTVKPLYKLD